MVDAFVDSNTIRQWLKRHPGRDQTKMPTLWHPYRRAGILQDSIDRWGLIPGATQEQPIELPQFWHL